MNRAWLLVSAFAAFVMVWLPASPAKSQCPPVASDSWEVQPAAGYDKYSPTIRANRRNQDRYVVAYELGADNWQYRYIVGNSRYTDDHSLEQISILNSTTARDSFTSFFWPNISPMSSTTDYKWFTSWTRINNAFLDKCDALGRLFSSGLLALGYDFNLKEASANKQTLEASSVMMSSNRIISVWEEHVETDVGIYQRLFDNNGVPLGVSVLVSDPEFDNMQPRVSALWSEGDKYVVAWVATADFGIDYSIVIQVFDSNGNPLTGHIIVVTNLPEQPWIDVAAVGTGFLLTYTMSGMEGVFLRTYNLQGEPFVPWYYITDDDSNSPGAPRVTSGWWSSGQLRPLPYFGVTWMDADPGLVARPRFALVRGVANPQILVTPQFLSLMEAQYAYWGVDAELFTGCSTDLRVGFAWSASDPAVAGGRYGIKRRFMAFTPDNAAASAAGTDASDGMLGLSTAEEAGEAIGLEAEQGSAEIMWLPELALDDPNEPDVPVLGE